jgi:hypothetical protein
MTKLRTQTQLQDFLDTELGWRIKEIADMKAAVKHARYLSERTVVRAGVALLYAHWEGFVKCAATGYVSYVNSQGLTYAELQSCFVVFGLKKVLHDLTESRKAKSNIVAIEFLQGQLSNRAQLKIETAINTEANLSSAVLNNILLSVGIDPSPYEPRYHLIDEGLLKRRNNIAHGEFLEVSREEWSSLADEILTMLRQLKTDIENATALAAFKK